MSQFRIIFFLFLVSTFLKGQTTYYSKSSGNLNTLATWGTNTNGTGTSPANFTSAGITYVITNTSLATISAAWAVSGAGSQVQLGDGTNPVEFIVPTTAAFTGTINVANSATLSILNTTSPTWGTLSSGSTINYARLGAQTINSAAFYNLHLSGSGLKSLSNTVDASISNSVIIDAGVRFRLHTSNTRTATITGSVTGAGAFFGNGNSNLVISGSGNFGNLTFTTSTTLYQLTIARTSSGLVSLGSNLTVSNFYNHTDGDFALGSNLLTLNGLISFPASASSGKMIGSTSASITINNNASTYTNSLIFDPSNSASRSLSRFIINRPGMTLQLGANLEVVNAFSQTNGLIDLNGNLLSLSGVLAFPSTTANGYFIASNSSSIEITGAGTISNALKLDPTSLAGRTISSFTLNHTGGTLTFGTDVNCLDAFVHTSGPLTLGTISLTLNGPITFPTSATNGSITGSATSSLIITGSGSITNALYMSQVSTAAETFNSFILNRGGQTLQLGNNTIINAFVQTNGNIDLNGSLLTINGAISFPAGISNGAFIGSITSSLAIGTNTGAITNDLIFSQSNAGTRSLSRFTINRVGQTLKLANNVEVLDAFTQTNGLIDLNGNSLSISGILAFPTASTNGYFIGSPSSTLIIGGAGAVTNALKLDQSTSNSQTLGQFIVDHTVGIITFGSNIICSADFAHNNGNISLGSNQLTLNGDISFPASASNGSITGSATSSLSIGGVGSLVNFLYISQVNATTRTLNYFSLSRSGQTFTLGNTITINTFDHSNSFIDLNGVLLTLNAGITFPVGLGNGGFIGSTTSSLVINANAALVTNPISFRQTNAASRSLSRFTYNRVGQTLFIGTSTEVLDAFTLTNGIIDLNGNYLNASGIIAFPTATTNGYFIGSSTSSLNIGGVGAITNALRFDQSTSAAKTLNAFTIDQTGGILTLGTDIICASKFIHTNGPIAIGTTSLTLNGAITFPASASNGSFTGSSTSSLCIGGSGAITNPLFLSQVSTVSRTLNRLSFNRAGQTLVLGNVLTVNEYNQPNGNVNLNGTLLTLNAAINFPAGLSNGSFIGSSTSSLVIGTNAAAMTNPLFFNQSSAANRTLSRFSVSRVGQTLTLGANLIVTDAFLHTAALFDLNAKSLTIGGLITFPTTTTNGYFIGSTSSSLTINGAGVITNTFKVDQSSSGSQSLNYFELNHTGGTLTFGGSLICTGPFVYTNGTITIGTNSLSLNGAITFPASASNGSITGSTTSSLSIAGSGNISNPLFMSQASTTTRSFNSLNMDRAGQNLVLGNPLIVNTYNHINGKVDLNGTLLTLNSAITFPASVSNGSFKGSLTSSITVAGSGAITNSLLMDQSNAASRSLYDYLHSRTGQTVTIGNQLEIRNSIRPSTGGIITGGFVYLKADATRSGMVGVVGGAISGNINVETYAPGGFTGWTNLGPTGVTGLTVADWESQFYITCFGCPYNENSAGGYFVSIQSYSEAASGSAAYIPLSYTTTLNRGQGYWVYLGTAQYTTAVVNYSVAGPVVSANVVLPLTKSANNGFNLVANPYPAPIDWDLVAADAANGNVSGSVYFYNPDLGQTISYAAGVSNPSGYIANGIIPAGQGFYVQANVATNITFRETHKSTQNTNANPLLRPAPADSIGTIFRLSIVGVNLDYDETAFRFHPQATDTFDRIYDARKQFETPGYLGTGPVWSKYTTISSRMGFDDYSINSISTIRNGNYVIPVLVKVMSAGAYTISPIDLDNFAPSTCVRLRDKLLNIDHDLRSGPYICNMSDTTSAPRFELIVCHDEFTVNGAKASANSKSNVLILQKDPTTVVVRTQFQNPTPSTIGVYNLSGQKLMPDKQIEENENTVTLDLSNYRGQVVIIKVSSEEGLVARKVLIN